MSAFNKTGHMSIAVCIKITLEFNGYVITQANFKITWKPLVGQSHVFVEIWILKLHQLNFLAYLVKYIKVAACIFENKRTHVSLHLTPSTTKEMIKLIMIKKSIREIRVYNKAILAPFILLWVVLPWPASAAGGARAEVVSVGHPSGQVLGRWRNSHDRHHYSPGRPACLRALIRLEDSIRFGLRAAALAGRVVRGAQERFWVNATDSGWQAEDGAAV